MMKVVVTTGPILVVQSSSQIVMTNKQTNTQLFTGGMPFLSSNQQCQSKLKGKFAKLAIKSKSASNIANVICKVFERILNSCSEL